MLKIGRTDSIFVVPGNGSIIIIELISKFLELLQIVFPLNKPSQSVFHGYYLDSQDLVDQIKNNKEATNNIIKSSHWFISFLERNMYWNAQHNHNQLRITRVIKCLRLLVSDEEADNFYNNVLELIKNNNQVNMRTLNFWKNT